MGVRSTDTITRSLAEKIVRIAVSDLSKLSDEELEDILITLCGGDFTNFSIVPDGSEETDDIRYENYSIQ
jgi:hypothetical protein